MCGFITGTCIDPHEAYKTVGASLRGWLIAVIVLAVVCPFAFSVLIALCVACVRRRKAHTTTVVTPSQHSSNPDAERATYQQPMCTHTHIGRGEGCSSSSSTLLSDSDVLLWRSIQPATACLSSTILAKPTYEYTLFGEWPEFYIIIYSIACHLHFSAKI